MPQKVKPVSNFELDKYLGKWHEIARLDHSFERGMNQVTATYSLREDGGVKVVNRGYSEIDQQWSEAEGKAYFVDKNDEGYLKVSFFGPFYGSYVIFELEKENYQYAFISGPSLEYLWLLSRTPKVPDDIIKKFLEMSAERGFNTSEIIFVDH
jgi:apolipoprotein D and lipocalin family protein